MSEPRRTDHVFLQGDNFVCLHCGDRYRMNLPCPISVMAAAAQAYSDIHQHCEPQEKPHA